MSARIDQRGKNQPLIQQPVNGSNAIRRDGHSDFDYSQMMHGQPIQPPFTTMPLTSPTSDNFNHAYYQPTYQSFFDGSGAWSTSTDQLSYLGSFNPISSDYPAIYPPFDYSQAFGWSYTNDYAAWGAAPQSTGKIEETLGQNYPTYYASPPKLQPDEPTEPEVQELEQGMSHVSVAGNGETGQESPGDVANDPANSNSNNSSIPVVNGGGSKKMSWANIASKPAVKNVPPKPPVILIKNSANKGQHETSGWEKNDCNGAGAKGAEQPDRPPQWNAPRSQRANGTAAASNGIDHNSNSSVEPAQPSPVLDQLKQTNQYNPKNFDLNAKTARFFIIKSYSEDDIHRAIKYSIWCSTEHGNKRLDSAFKERDGKGPVYLFFSVNGSGHFCGMAQMMSGVDYDTQSNVWTQDKWKGRLEIKWIYVKDVPNGQLRHIRLENNENKPVTNSRDTQEVPPEKGRQVLKVMHTYRHTTSIFDDFSHYEKKQEEEDTRKKTVPSSAGPSRR